jgi:hypothetical protein
MNFFKQKINYFAKELAEMDRLCSYISSYELQDPEFSFRSGIRPNMSVSDRIQISNTDWQCLWRC